MPERIGEALLHDAVDRERGGIRQLNRTPVAVPLDLESRVTKPAHERVEVVHSRLRPGLLVVPQFTEQHPHVGERAASRRRDVLERLDDRCRHVLGAVARPVGLRDHDRERVGDDVVNVAGDAVAFLLERDLLLDLAESHGRDDLTGLSGSAGTIDVDEHPGDPGKCEDREHGEEEQQLPLEGDIQKPPSSPIAATAIPTRPAHRVMIDRRRRCRRTPAAVARTSGRTR